MAAYSDFGGRAGLLVIVVVELLLLLSLLLLLLLLSAACAVGTCGSTLLVQNMFIGVRLASAVCV